MPRDDAYRFVALGAALERADNVARLLDVKFFEGATSELQNWDAKGEYYHWAAILRSCPIRGIREGGLIEKLDVSVTVQTFKQ